MREVPSSVVAAAILAGGDSHRMGQDKASLEDNSRSLIAKQVLDLRDLSSSLPIYICAGSRRYPELADDDIRYLPDSIDSAGPLSGISEALQTAARHNPDDGYILVVPTDSLIPPSKVCKRLTDAVSTSSDVMLLKGKRLHPLHGLFSTRLGSRMQDYVESGGRAVMGFLDNEAWEPVTAPAEWEPCLNFNTPEEYQLALSAFAKMTSL